MKTKIAFHTFGCKLNFSESSSIISQFREDEYEIVDFREKADIYVVNTCSVTGMAEKKCRHAIRQARNLNPAASIAVIGCFSQLKPEELATFDGVDVILGSNTKFRLLDILKSRQQGCTAPPLIITDTKESQQDRDNFIPSFSSGERTRSFIKVQDGCNYFCSYCTIPFARGLSRSGSIARVLETVSQALRSGVKEIILTGVNVADFGHEQGEDFLGLIQALETVNRIPRIRISSIEPDLLSMEMIDFIAGSKRFMPHFHIPLQSGSAKILRAMNRKYTPGLFSARVLKIKELMPFACIAADVIVGFPGESDEDFEETYAFIDGLPLSYCHVFTYSERLGTKAAGMAGKIKDKVKTERSRSLHHLSDLKKRTFYMSNAGRKEEVLFESTRSANWMYGFTRNYVRVKTPYDAKLVNEIRGVTLLKPLDDGCFAVAL